MCYSSSDWRPSASKEVILARAQLNQVIRQFFAERGVIEVDTPILSDAANTDPQLSSFTTRYLGPGFARGRRCYLQTSPEFPMKRMLAAGIGPIYQLCKVFRDGEWGRLHNPEFTLLEWYRPGYDHFALMQELEALLLAVPCETRTWSKISYMTYQQAFEKYAQIDPHTAKLEAIARRIQDFGFAIPKSMDELEDLSQRRDAYLDLLLTHQVEAHLGRSAPVFIYDYPASQASLAKVRPGSVPLAERFELYWQGVELANGFHELTHYEEQYERFQRDLQHQSKPMGDATRVDKRFLAALQAGLPACAGVALGIDRLLMINLGKQSVHEVLTFPFDKA